MNIREAKIEDLEKISVLIKQVSDLHYEARKNIFKLKELKSISEYIETVINDEQVNVVIAEEDGTVCRSSYIQTKTNKRSCQFM